MNSATKNRLPQTTNQTIFDAVGATTNTQPEDFDPVGGEGFRPTDAPPGTRAKLEVMAERVRKGWPLWHPEDSSGEGMPACYVGRRNGGR